MGIIHCHCIIWSFFVLIKTRVVHCATYILSPCFVSNYVVVNQKWLVIMFFSCLKQFFCVISKLANMTLAIILAGWRYATVHIFKSPPIFNLFMLWKGEHLSIRCLFLYVSKHSVDAICYSILWFWCISVWRYVENRALANILAILAIHARGKNGDNSILVRKGLKMQNNTHKKCIAKKLAGLHNAIHYWPLWT